MLTINIHAWSVAFSLSPSQTLNCQSSTFGQEKMQTGLSPHSGIAYFFTSSSLLWCWSPVTSTKSWSLLHFRLWSFDRCRYVYVMCVVDRTVLFKFCQCHLQDIRSQFYLLQEKSLTVWSGWQGETGRGFLYVSHSSRFRYGRLLKCSSTRAPHK